MAARARLVPAGQTGTDPDGEEITITAGDVKLDAGAKIRATVDLTTSRSWPASSSDALAPYGGELFVERGIAYGNGTTEYVSQGYFRLEDVEQKSLQELRRIAASDRMAGIVDAQLLAPVQFGAGALLGTVVDQLVREVYPSVVIEWDDTTDQEPIGRQLVADRDRYGFLADIVTSAGKTWSFDHRGVLVIRELPDPTDPVLDVAGGEGGVLVTMGRQLTRSGVYNAVVATGEAPDTAAPARGVVIDGNPASPTFFHGPFGPVPRFYGSPLLTTDAQATKAATTLLRQALGLPYSVDFDAVPNPSLEPLDPVRIVRPATADEVHVIDQLTIPLTPAGAMKATTREQTLVQIGQLT